MGGFGKSPLASAGDGGALLLGVLSIGSAKAPELILGDTLVCLLMIGLAIGEEDREGLTLIGSLIERVGLGDPLPEELEEL